MHLVSLYQLPGFFLQHLLNWFVYMLPLLFATRKKKGYIVIKRRESIQIRYPMINPSDFIVLHTFNITMKASSLNWNMSPSED